MTLTEPFRLFAHAGETAKGITERHSESAETDRRADADIAALVGAYTPLLFRVVHSILRSQSEAEDTVQDVFLRVLAHRERLAEIVDMRVWLVRIAWNLALDRKRRIRPDQMDESFVQALVARDLPADEALAEARRMQNILAEIDRLPKAERQVLLLSAVEELGTPAMAEVLGRSESATRALLFRARTRLKDRLAKGGHQ